MSECDLIRGYALLSYETRGKDDYRTETQGGISWAFALSGWSSFRQPITKFIKSSALAKVFKIRLHFLSSLQYRRVHGTQLEHNIVELKVEAYCGRPWLG